MNRHNDIKNMDLIIGAARMGNDPQIFIVNKWNQVYACNNIFVTEGACMRPASAQKPSLTYMTLTARVVGYAVSEMKKGNIE